MKLQEGDDHISCAVLRKVKGEQEAFTSKGIAANIKKALAGDTLCDFLNGGKASGSIVEMDENELNELGSQFVQEV